MALKGTVVDLNNIASKQSEAEQPQETNSSNGATSLQELQNSLTVKPQEEVNSKVEYIENKDVNPEASKHASSMPEEFSKRFDRKYEKITVQLPSKGLYYTKGSSCHGLSEVIVRQLTAPDEDVLFSRKLILNGRVFDTILQRVMQSKIDIADLLATDKSAILLALRMNAYGTNYDCGDMIACPHCELEFKYEFDLSILEPKATEDIIINDDGTFEVPLASGVKLTMKYLTSREEEQIEKNIANKNKMFNNGGIDHSFTMRLQNQIIAINGNSDKSYIREYIESGSLKLHETRAIRKFLTSHIPEIEMKQSINCTGCLQEFVADIPITREFFYPSI